MARDKIPANHAAAIERDVAELLHHEKVMGSLPVKVKNP